VHSADSTALLHMMVNLSQRLFRSQWEPSLEYILYDAVIAGPIQTPNGKLDHIEVDQLRTLAKRAGGWWTSTEYQRYHFMTTEQWVNHLQETGEL
jgi:hypothetical protein